MSPEVEGAGVALHVHERGAGPPVLLLHGLATDGRRWDDVTLPARLIAPDRRASGGSGAPEPHERTTVEEQAEDVAAVLRALDAHGAVGAGEDFGALVLLDLLKRHPEALRAAVLVEPPLFAFVPEATEWLGDERERLEAAVRAGGVDGAMLTWCAHNGHVDRVTLSHSGARAFFADYGALTGWSVTRAELRAIAVPLIVLVRPTAPPHVCRAAEALVALAPRAELRSGADVAGAIGELL